MAEYFNPYLGKDAFGEFKLGVDGHEDHIASEVENLWKRTGQGILAYAKGKTNFVSDGTHLNLTRGTDEALDELNLVAGKASKTISKIGGDASGSYAQVRNAINKRIQTRRRAIKDVARIQDVEVRRGNVYGDYRDALTGERRSIYDHYTNEEIENLADENMAQFAEFNREQAMKDAALNRYSTWWQGRTYDEEVKFQEEKYRKQFEDYGSRYSYDDVMSMDDSELYDYVRGRTSGGHHRYIEERTLAANAVNHMRWLENMFSGGHYKKFDAMDGYGMASGRTRTFKQEIEAAGGYSMAAHVLSALRGDQGETFIKAGPDRYNRYDPLKILDQFEDFYNDSIANASKTSKAAIRAELKQRRSDVIKATQQAALQERQTANNIRQQQEEADVQIRELKRGIDEDQQSLQDIMRGQDQPIKNKRRVSGVSFSAGRPT